MPQSRGIGYQERQQREEKRNRMQKSFPPNPEGRRR